MPRTMLKDEHWTRLRPILLELNIYDKGNLRNTVEGVLYRMRVGCPWRDLPAYFGKPNTVYKAYQHSSGGNEKAQAISKSVAGRATKIHLAVDAHGNHLYSIEWYNPRC
ncbi:transposase [Psychrobacter sp. PL15]|nr:transposase [Psychrobacter sp. PL15]